MATTEQCKSAHVKTCHTRVQIFQADGAVCLHRALNTCVPLKGRHGVTHTALVAVAVVAGAAHATKPARRAVELALVAVVVKATHRTEVRAEKMATCYARLH